MKRLITVFAVAIAMMVGSQAAFAAETPKANYCPDTNELQIPPGQAAAALDVKNQDLPDTINLKIEVEGTTVAMFKKILSTKGKSQGKGNQGDGTNIILIGDTTGASTLLSSISRTGGDSGPYVATVDLEALAGSGAAPKGPNPNSGFEFIGFVNIGEATQLTLYVERADGTWVLMDINETCE
jgi:hypothetical protein